MSGPTTKRPNAEQPSKLGRKKQKVMSPEVQVRLAINMATKAGDVQKAFAAYDQCKANGTKLFLDSYCSLFFLCSGGESWEAALATTGNSTPSGTAVHTQVTPEVMERGRQMMKDMQTSDPKLEPNEIW
jgi:Pentacotripeptide-repeat region of PRORP